MNFAETAVKDHSAEQRPSRAGPHPQQGSHSLASGCQNRNSHGVEMDPKPGFLPSTGVRLSCSGTAQITAESLPQAQDLAWCVQLSHRSCPTVTSPSQSPPNPGARLQPPSSWAIAGIKGKRRTTTATWKELRAAWHELCYSGSSAKQRQFPCTPPWVALFQSYLVLVRSTICFYY